MRNMTKLDMLQNTMGEKMPRYTKGKIKPKSRLASRRFSQKMNKQTKQIRPFVFWEKLADHKLLSRLTDL